MYVRLDPKENCVHDTGHPHARRIRSRLAAAAPGTAACRGREGDVSPGRRLAPAQPRVPVVVYVLDGAVRSKVGGGPEVLHNAGQSFYEAPDSVHAVSANGSKKRAATFLAYFVCAAGKS